MTTTPAIPPELEARIHERIARLGPGRRRAAARAELHDHVVQAVQAMAAGGRPGPEHVEAAFAALGSDREVREAFFPRPPRARLQWPEVALLAGAAALAGLAIALDGGGEASCEVTGTGRCTATASGVAWDVLAFAAPPLVALACLAWLPAWTALLPSGAFAAVTLLRAMSGSGGAAELALDLGLLGAGAATLAAVLLALRRPRRSPDA
jgi:hypothetical protein